MRRVQVILAATLFWLVVAVVLRLARGPDWLDSLDGGRYLPRDELVRMSET